ARRSTICRCQSEPSNSPAARRSIWLRSARKLAHSWSRSELSCACSGSTASPRRRMKPPRHEDTKERHFSLVLLCVLVSLWLILSECQRAEIARLAGPEWRDGRRNAATG